jgi:hypothetical protein
MATKVKTSGCEHSLAGTCDVCVRLLTDRADGPAKDNQQLREQVKRMGDQIDGFDYSPDNADALAAMLPDEGFDSRAPAGCTVHVARYHRPPQCRVEITLPAGAREIVDLRDLPRLYAALRAAK